jgi:hypothetical protein
MDRDDVQLDETVRKQNARAGLEILSQRREGGGDQGRGAGDIPWGNGELLSCFELNGDAVLQPASTNLGSLQITQDAQRLAFFGRDLAHHFNELELFGMGAVGKIKPRNIQAGADQLAENGFVVTGRAQGGNNLGTAALFCGKGRARFHQGKTHSSPILRSRRR